MAKQVFFGSLFEFNDAGCEEFINNFRNGLPDPDSAPFVSYDKTRKIFSCAVEHNDHNLITIFINQFQSYLEYHTSTKPGDLVESPRIRPIDGTTVRGESAQPEPLNQKFIQMVDYEEESDYSEDNSSLDHAIAYWAPANGDVRILTTDIAAMIAQSTGCSLFAEPSEKRVKLVNGDLQLALTKLQNLEPIMGLIARHKSKLHSKADGNVLAIRNGDPSAVVKLDRPVQPHCGFDRIITDPAIFTLLDRILLSEIRYPGGNEYKPRNLDLAPDVVKVLETTGPSQIFENVKMRAFGDPSAVKPIVRTEPASTSNGSDIQVPGPNKYLQGHEANRVTEWTRGVEVSADPDIAPAQPAPEGQPTGRRRVVAEDSSDEDNYEKEEQPKDRAARSIVTPTSTESAKAAQDLVTRSSAAAQNRNKYTTTNPFDLLGSERDSMSSQLGEQADFLPSTQSKPAHGAGNLIDLTSNIGKSSSETRDNAAKLHATKASPTRSATGNQPIKSNAQYQSPRASPISTNTKSKEIHNAWPLPEKREYQQYRPYQRDSHQVSRMPQDGHASQNRHSASGPKKSKNDLIDVSVARNPSPWPQLAPPGAGNLDAFIKSSPKDLIDEPAEAGRVPSVVNSPSKSSKTRSESVVSVPNSNASWNPQYTVPKRNVNYLKEQAAATLKREMNARRKLSQDRSIVSNNPLPPERVEAVDESKTRKFHQSMNQKTAQPKKGKGKAQESKDEREARIAKAMADAYGQPAPSRNTSSPSKSAAQAEPISAAKQKLIRKNPVLATMHPEVLQKNALEEQTTSLKAGLVPLFEACRAFSGELLFEIQIGQALVLSNDHINDQTRYKPKEWSKLVDANAQNSTHVTFTNIVTTNGLEIDRLFSIKANGTISDLWDWDTPETTSVVYTFRCLDKSGHDFYITIDQDHQYKIAKNRLTIGNVILHCPQQIWDACANLTGQKMWADPPSDLVQSVDQFVKSVYITEKATVPSVYYRLPSNNAFNVRDIVVERSSVHRSKDPKLADFHLRFTEVKNLIHSLHPNDKKLFRSYELGYHNMVEKGKLYYKIAIVPVKINYALRQNKNLEVGEMTLEANSGKALLTAATIRSIVDVTTYMVAQIDWLGATNIGTMRRIFEEAQHKQAIINASLPPQALTQIGHAVAINRSTIGAPTFNPSTPRTTHPAGTTHPGQANLPSTLGGHATTESNLTRPIVRGVRAGTHAELYHQDGQFFYYGQGGAKIPVVDRDLVSGLQNMSSHLNVSSEPLMPGDSASQIGGDATRVTRTLPIRGTGLGVAGPRERHEKPPGFW